MNELLIVFIEPPKFADLLANKKKMIYSYDENTREKSYLENHKKIAYLFSNNQIEIDYFDNDKMNNSYCIIISDHHSEIEEFKPNKPFKILHHGNGIPLWLKQFLEKNLNYSGIKEDREDDDTLYEKLAKCISVENNIFRFDSKEIHEIYNGIRNHNPILEAKLELLHNCFFSKPPENLVDELSGFTAIFKDYKNGKKTLLDLRDHLLDS